MGAGSGKTTLVVAEVTSLGRMDGVGTQNQRGLGGITADGGKLVNTLLQLNDSPAE